MEQSKKPPRSYKELKQKQKAKISDYMYLETQNFFQTNGRMPDMDEDCEAVAQKVFNHILRLACPHRGNPRRLSQETPSYYRAFDHFRNAGAYPFPRGNQGIAAHPSRKKSPYQTQKETCPKGAGASCPWSRTTPFSSSQVTPPVVRHMVLPGRKWDWSRGKI